MAGQPGGEAAPGGAGPCREGWRQRDGGQAVLAPTLTLNAWNPVQWEPS